MKKSFILKQGFLYKVVDFAYKKEEISETVKKTDSGEILVAKNAMLQFISKGEKGEIDFKK